MKMQVFGKPYESKDRWDQMMAVRRSCEVAGIDVPDEVNEFFDAAQNDDDDPEEFPEVDLETEDRLPEETVIVHDDGFTINLDKLMEYNDNYNPEFHFLRFKVSDI